MGKDRLEKTNEKEIKENSTREWQIDGRESGIYGPWESWNAIYWSVSWSTFGGISPIYSLVQYVLSSGPKDAKNR